MEIASHNTFTFMPVRQWWFKILAFTARCQRWDIEQQIFDGVRMFDLRVRFRHDGVPVICHGLVEFKHDAMYLYDVLNDMNNRKDMYVRVVLETSKADEQQEAFFKRFCKTIEQCYPSIKFFGGNNRLDWGCKAPIYQFQNPVPDIDEKHASTTSLFPNGPKWLRWIDDLCPILYAKRNNRKIIEAGTEHDWLLIDFVDIQ